MELRYSSIGQHSTGYWLWLLAVGIVLILGLYAAHMMDSEGHVITGMTNRIVWGLPHVFAIFLILAASGALNVASLGSVFGQADYKPLARLSGLLAIALLVGGLAVLVLDLGRPDRLIVAMTYYNFKSIFAWNIFLYTGFIVIVAVYLWLLFERRLNHWSKPAGLLAFIWRFVLTTGTGAIFGFLVARQAYDAAIMAPLFIAMSLAFGTAVFLLVWLVVCRSSSRTIETDVIARLNRLLGIFVAVVLYLTLVFHLTNLYVTEHHGVERFILLDGGIYTGLFWFGQVLLGGLIPLALCFSGWLKPTQTAVLASILVILGGFAQLYVIIIGGQAYPLQLFPGLEVRSSFFDGVVAEYSPSLFEFLLGLGGIGLALMILSIGLRVLPFMPERVGAG